MFMVGKRTLASHTYFISVLGLQYPPSEILIKSVSQDKSCRKIEKEAMPYYFLCVL